MQIDIRWGLGSDTELIRKNVAKLVALTPDVILAIGSPIVGALQQATRTMPIVFVAVVDPVSAGFVASLARPAGNATGFTSFEYGTSAKWLEHQRHDQAAIRGARYPAATSSRPAA